MSEPLIIVTAPAEGVSQIRINRPDKRNALDTPTARMVAEALAANDASESVRVTIITGGDKIFVAGADLNEMATKTGAEALCDPRVGFWKAIRAVRKPIIAAVEGWCLGAGNELLMCCDIAVASREAKFGQPETNLGIMPGAGGAAVLPRLVGRSLAMKMVLLGAPITAEEARAYGLVAELSEPGCATARAVELAVQLAARAPLAVQRAKAVVNATYELPLSQHYEAERAAFAALLDTEDKTEGVAAFLERRTPVWRGK